MLADNGGSWRVWMLRTWLEAFKGHGHPDVLEAGAPPPQASTHADCEEVDAVVVGAGQNGLSVAGRLHALGLRYVLVEKLGEIGENWTSRYDAMHWNTPKEFGNLPFDRTFNASDPEYLKATHIARGYKSYVSKYHINVQLNTRVSPAASFDSFTRQWIVPLTCYGKTYKLRCAHLILTTGLSGSRPSYPSIPNSGAFQGDVRHALTGWRSAAPWAGKRGLVIGTGNTGMDCALEMLEQGMSVTLVQRSKILVLKKEWVQDAMKTLSPALYDRSIPTSLADCQGFTSPTAISRLLTNSFLHPLQSSGPAQEWYRKLESRGLRCEQPGDIIGLLHDRLGGYYYDFGACDAIIRGDIQVKSNSSISNFTSTGLRFEDGDNVDADVVLWATGFEKDHRPGCAQVVGEEIASTLEDYWGLDGEGEVRGVYKEFRSGGDEVMEGARPNSPEYAGLWLLGGDCRRARWYSRFVALGIQASVLGQPLRPSK